jgi:hypothetical protein
MSIFTPTAFYQQVIQAAPAAGVVTNGLISYIDPGNPSCYPGSGATLTDLSGTGNNATLVNSPTYNSGNGGYFTLNGTNQYINFATTGLPNTGHTVMVWWMQTTLAEKGLMATYEINPDTGTPYRYIRAGNGTCDTYAYDTSPGYVTLSSYSANTWYNITLTNTTTTQQGYWNNSQVITNRTVGTAGDDTKISFGNGYHGYLTGRIAVILIYNRALSASEITENYNFFNSRY